MLRYEHRIYVCTAWKGWETKSKTDKGYKLLGYTWPIFQLQGLHPGIRTYNRYSHSCGSSSDKSGTILLEKLQSGSPSHIQPSGIHLCVRLHWNCPILHRLGTGTQHQETDTKIIKITVKFIRLPCI